MEEPQYEKESYSKEDLKVFLLKEFKKFEETERLEEIIDTILENNKSLYKNCSQRAFLISGNKIIKEKIQTELDNISYKHSKNHYTNIY